MKACIECHKFIKNEAKFCSFCSTKQPLFFEKIPEDSSERIEEPFPSRYFDPDNNPQNMQPIEARWRPVLDRIGIQTIGIREIPTRPTSLSLNGIKWKIFVLKDDETYDVPPETLERIQASEKAGLEVDCWILMDEQPPAIPEPTRRRDPVLVGVIGISAGRGTWCVFGKWDH